MVSNLLRHVRHSIPMTILVSLAGMAHMASAQTTGLPPGANTTNPAAPFFIDLSGLDFSTSPPTLPPQGAHSNYIIGTTHDPSPEAIAQNVPKGRVFTFTMTSEENLRRRAPIDGA